MKKHERNFGLSTLALRNSTSVFILTAIISVAGLFAYLNMPKESFPEIVIPTVYINTVYPGNSPLDIENLITRPLEKELDAVKGVKKISSTSAQDVSIIIIEFNENVDIRKALQDTKDAIDRAKKDLPNDLDRDPVAMELDFTEIPIMEINLSGDFEIEKLKEYAEKLEEEIEMLPEVRRVDVLGAVEREIQINVDLYKMEAMKVTFNDIEQAITSENMTISGGDIMRNGFRRSLRIDGEFKSVEEIANIIVKHEDQNIIFLRDVAEVIDTYEERKSYSHLGAAGEFLTQGMKPVVSVKVIKKGGENLVFADAKIQAILQKAQKTYLPSHLNIVITNSQAEDIKKQISNLENSIISGVILVVGVLLFFMGLRNATFVGIAIPLSMFISFLILNSFGITINIVVLFALIIALGMLVDNGIVVIENIYRLREEGYDNFEAARLGVGEVALPIISSTLTTVAAFVPLAFWGGILGEFMKYLPITLIIVLSASLFVGLIINPVVAAKFMRLEVKGEKRNYNKLLIASAIAILMALVLYATGKPYTIANLLMTFALISLFNAYLLRTLTDWFQNTFLVWLERIYRSFLEYALTGYRPYAFFVGTFVILILSIALFTWRAPEISLFPSAEPKFINVFIELPQGTDTKSTLVKTREIEQRIFQILKPHENIVKSIVTNVGKGTKGEGLESSMSADFTPNRAKVTVHFIDYKLRGEEHSTKQILKEISDEMKKIPGAVIQTEKNRVGPPVGKPVSIEVTGEDYITLIHEAERIQKLIEQAGIEGLDGLKMEIELGKPEIILHIDRAAARRYGLSTAQIAMALRTSVYGKEISKFKDGENDYPIMLRLDEKYRTDMTALSEQKITFRDNKGKWHQIPISAVATIENTTTFGSVRRKDLDRMIVVSSNVQEGYNANEIVAQIKSVLQNHQIKEGYRFRFGGEQEEQAKSMAFLMKALLIAVAAIFLILVSQFNSVVKPFIITTSILFSTIGVFLGLFFAGDDFIIIMTGIGIISLAGVVVNNAIVLIDYTNLTIERRKSELGLSEKDALPWQEVIQSLIEAGFTRLRPVLLTAITTVLGLFPLAIGLNLDFVGLYQEFKPDIYWGGENADFWGPMAWTVIYGLTFSTFLTLVIVPVMYLLSEKLARMFAK
ncbi:MAG: efflux RND transporter permease subunit [Cytophagales bacterium]|nr:efflux RND transporter permease subunit [Cytophagales bacterium]MDW8383652.1 efflux RND transporter permease subunit [Flammeovirgaceae bacterium]